MCAVHDRRSLIFNANQTGMYVFQPIFQKCKQTLNTT